MEAKQNIEELETKLKEQKKALNLNILGSFFIILSLFITVLVLVYQLENTKEENNYLKYNLNKCNYNYDLLTNTLSSNLEFQGPVLNIENLETFRKDGEE